MIRLKRNARNIFISWLQVHTPPGKATPTRRHPVKITRMSRKTITHVIMHGQKETEMDIQIRKAKTSDVSAISNLLRSLNLFASINNEDAKSTQQRVQEHFTLCMSDDSHLILVAQTADGEITGYCAVHWLPYLILAGPEGYVSELFIKEEFRGQGIGNNLLEAIKVEAQNRGCSR